MSTYDGASPGSPPTRPTTRGSSSRTCCIAVGTPSFASLATRHPSDRRRRLPRRLRRRRPHGALPRRRRRDRRRCRRVVRARAARSAGGARRGSDGARSTSTATSAWRPSRDRPCAIRSAAPARGRGRWRTGPVSIVVLTLDRPAAMNAIDNAMLAALHAALDDVEADATVRGVVLAGAGERAFCAGMDLKERAGFSDDDLRAQRALIVALIRRLHELPVPIDRRGRRRRAGRWLRDRARVRPDRGRGDGDLRPARGADRDLPGRWLDADPDLARRAGARPGRDPDGSTADRRRGRGVGRGRARRGRRAARGRRRSRSPGPSPRARRSASARRRRRSAVRTARSPRASRPRTPSTRRCW